MDAVSAAPARRSRRPRSGRTRDGPRRIAVGEARPGPAGPPLRIAMLAPPWISVPPPGYGGVESVVSALTEALVRRGHAVTLFCAPGSVSRADVVTLLDESHPDEIERSLYEVDHVAQAFDEIDLAAVTIRFDVVHDHCGFTALAMADRIDTPLVHTLHGQFTAGHRGLLRPPRPQGGARRHQPRAARVGAARVGADRLDPEPDRPAGLAAAGAQGRLPALDREDDRREGAAPRDRRRSRRGRAARAGRRHPARTAGVLRPRGRAAHRRRARPLRRRGRRRRSSARCSRAPAGC